MAGIYLHIPFCKTRCIYCDFYSTTNSELKEPYILSLCRELEMRKEYLQGEPIETIYLGGGTPSQLTGEDFRRIFEAIEQHFGEIKASEITLEANPDDLTPDYLQVLSELPFNRISMGVQTFNEEILRLLNRRHTAVQAINAVNLCRKAGFKNISIDLIYGLPGETDATWETDLQKAIDLDVEHISAYHLTYEKNTPIYTMLLKQRIHEVDEDASVRYFARLIDRLTDAGYEHYEISNFCRPGLQSKHNTAYWQGVPYLGCGPSAHSFNLLEREWNVSSLNRYIKGIESGSRISETEALDLSTRYNDFIITSLRTRWGISLIKLRESFGTELYDYCLRMAHSFLKSEKLQQTDESLRLTREGIFVSDSIMSDLLYVEDKTTTHR